VLAAGLLVGDEDEADVVGRSGAKLAEGLSGDSAKEILAANMCLETPISLYLE
jgi:hypothetical protein